MGNSWVQWSFLLLNPSFHRNLMAAVSLCCVFILRFWGVEPYAAFTIFISLTFMGVCRRSTCFWSTNITSVAAKTQLQHYVKSCYTMHTLCLRWWGFTYLTMLNGLAIGLIVQLNYFSCFGHLHCGYISKNKEVKQNDDATTTVTFPVMIWEETMNLTSFTQMHNEEQWQVKTNTHASKME